MMLTNSLLLMLFGPLLVFATCPWNGDPEWNAEKWSENTITTRDEKCDGAGCETVEIVIDTAVLLDRSPLNRLGGIKIKKGGKLIFKNNVVGGLKVVTKHIDIEGDGEMWIGSEQCKYEGEAEIVLTGMFHMENKGDSRFGKKYIGVRANGTLEIHGEVKTPWTRLTETLEPVAPLELLEVGADSTEINGITLVEFNRATGKHVKTTTVNKQADLTSELKALNNKDEFVLLVQNRFQSASPPKRANMTGACPKNVCKNDCDPASWDKEFVPTEFQTEKQVEDFIAQAFEERKKIYYKKNGEYKEAWADKETRDNDSHMKKIRENNWKKYNDGQEKKNKRQEAIDLMKLDHEPFQFICNPKLIDDAMKSVLGVNPQLDTDKTTGQLKWQTNGHKDYKYWSIKPRDVHDTWLLVIEKKDNEIRLVNQDITEHYSEYTTESGGSSIQITIDANHEYVISASKSKWKEPHTLNVQVNHLEDHVATIQVEHEVQGWKVGDHFVIASTDFDMNQAEEFVIKEMIGSRMMKVRTKDGGVVKYTHYGEKYGDLDMRAEVGLLTRNIKIRGEMSDRCYITSGQNNIHCKNAAGHNGEFDQDFFGGHTKALKGFKKYNIEGAELSNMGQHDDSGKYPIHMHLAEDVSGKAIIHQNSLHHNFARCVTLHYTHNGLVTDNVAYDTFGHCFFIEDGGEMNNVITGNLGLVTRQGFLTATDRSGVSTFWISSPLNTCNNNVAAGSDVAGFWLIFVQKRLVAHLDKVDYEETMEVNEKWWNDQNGHKGMGCKYTLQKGYGFRKAKRYAFRPMMNNVAHSNGGQGLVRLGRVDDPGKFGGCAAYDPRKGAGQMQAEDEVVTGENKPLDPIIVDNLTAYKNKKTNVVIAAPGVRILNSNLGESRSAIKVERNPLHGYTLIRDVNIYMTTDNIGVPSTVTLVGTKQQVQLERSYPGYQTNDDGTRNGVWIRGEGPVHIHNVNFHNVVSNPAERFCAITLRANSPRAMGITSSTKGLSFPKLDTETKFNDTNIAAGSKICRSTNANIEGDEENQEDVEQNGSDTDSVNFTDLDGTLVGTDRFENGQKHLVINNKDYLTEKLNCEDFGDETNMKVCDGEFYRFYSYPKQLVAAFAEHGQFITNGTAANEMKAVNKQNPKAGMLTFTGNAKNRLAIHWTDRTRETFLVRVLGLSKLTAKSQIIGFCLPELQNNNNFYWTNGNQDGKGIEMNVYLDLKPAVQDDDSASGFTGDEIAFGNEKGNKTATETDNEESRNAANGIYVAKSYDELETDVTKTAFFDKTTRIMWVRLSDISKDINSADNEEWKNKNMEDDDPDYYGDCGGGLLINECPFVSFDFTRLMTNEFGSVFKPNKQGAGDCSAL